MSRKKTCGCGADLDGSRNTYRGELVCTHCSIYFQLGREESYQPPFSGGRGQPEEEFALIHDRWAKRLRRTWPSGVPAELPIEGTKPGAFIPWPATFGSEVADGSLIHASDEGQGYCLQCGGCTYYIPLEGKLGGDWGACSNPKSQYDRTCVFEHWTCKEFKR